VAHLVVAPLFVAVVQRHGQLVGVCGVLGWEAGVEGGFGGDDVVAAAVVQAHGLHQGLLG
jgi:hypothetical protein